MDVWNFPLFIFYFPSERYMTLGLYHCLVDYLDFVCLTPVYILTLRRRFSFLSCWHPLPNPLMMLSSH